MQPDISVQDQLLGARADRQHLQEYFAARTQGRDISGLGTDDRAEQRVRAQG